MKHLAAYLLLTLAGNTAPTSTDIKEVLGSVGIDADEERLAQLLSELQGKEIDEVRYIAIPFVLAVMHAGLGRVWFWVLTLRSSLPRAPRSSQRELDPQLHLAPGLRVQRTLRTQRFEMSWRSRVDMEMIAGVTMRTLDWACLSKTTVDKSVVYTSGSENIISNRAGFCAKTCPSSRSFRCVVSPIYCEVLASSRVGGLRSLCAYRWMREQGHAWGALNERE
jgi:hypothetical protein